jgi:ABC-type lipoprotein export system ATPase subunit
MTSASPAAVSSAPDARAPRAAGPPPAIIELDQVTRQFAGKRDVVALDAVSLTIPRGEMVSIIGPSGSGKSTLLNLVGGLDRPSSGQVSIDGEPLAGLGDDQLTRVRRDKIGFIFQFFNLLPTLSSLENVGLPLHLRGWPRKKVEERARELLSLVKLEPRMDHLPDELSGGERQRVAVARALANEPLVLLADEPTGNLDEWAARGVFDLFREINSLGMTVLMATHDLDLVRAHPEYRVIELAQGQVVYDSKATSPSPASAPAAARSVEVPATADTHGS